MSNGGTYPQLSMPQVNAPPSPPDITQSTQGNQSASQIQTPLELMPPEEPTEFQEFVASSYGRHLALFGYDLFSQVPTTFAPLDRVPVTSDYVIGPGDELLVRVWGQIDLDARVEVDRTGDIYLPKVGTIKVAGLQFVQLQGHLKAAVGRVFRNFDLSVNLGQLRSIRVFVVGKARRPGSYTVSSLSTLVNTLFAAGGPSNKGSMRHIQLLRDNKLVTEFDFYDLLLRGDKSHDAVLLPGDVIFIPPVGPQTAIGGSVNTPAIYELTDTANPNQLLVASAEPGIYGSRKLTDTTDLSQLIELAGGLTNLADGQRVTVERIYEHAVRKIEEFPLDDGGRKHSIQDGDFVRVISLSPRFDNAVTLRGNVAVPGRYAWRPGMRIRDLIPTRETLIRRDYWEQQNAAAQAWDGPNSSRDYHGPDDESPEEPSEGTSASVSALKAAAKAHKLTPGVNIASLTSKSRGRSSHPADDDANEEQTESAYWTSENKAASKHQVRSLPKSEINWDYALIQRMEPGSLSTHLVPFNLREAIEGGGKDNLELEAGDIVTIFSQADIRVPVRKQSTYVYLEGEFNRAGIYKTRPGETLKQLVQRAGGLTSQAYLYGAEFTRQSTRQQQQKALREMVRQEQDELQRESSLMLAKSTTNDDLAALKFTLENQQAALAKLGHIEPTGRIVFNVRPDDAGIDSLPDIVLEDGDRFFIPYRLSSVSVTGQVYNNGTFLYDPRKTVKDYLRDAGGGTRDADAAKTFVLRANGSVISKSSHSNLWTASFEGAHLMPGDTLVLPLHVPHDGIGRQFKDWAQIFSQFALGAAAIKVLKNP